MFSVLLLLPFPPDDSIFPREKYARFCYTCVSNNDITYKTSSIKIYQTVHTPPQRSLANTRKERYFIVKNIEILHYSVEYQTESFDIPNQNIEPNNRTEKVR